MSSCWVKGPSTPWPLKKIIMSDRMIDRLHLRLESLTSISDEQAELPHHCAAELHGWMLTLRIDHRVCVARWTRHIYGRSLYMHTNSSILSLDSNFEGNQT